MNITEKDVFDFVFEKESLSEEIKNFLKSTNSFDEQIKFYTELKNSIDVEISPELKKKFADKIPEYTLTNVVELHPQIEKKIIKPGRRVLAAASDMAKPQITSKTFYDENRNFIVKLLNYESTSKIFVFGIYDELIKNFTLNILPQNLHFHMQDNSLPLELDIKLDPDSISLEFNMNDGFR